MTGTTRRPGLDDEEFCPDCCAGTESSQHIVICLVPTALAMENVSTAQMRAALVTAEGWAEHGYSPRSRAYHEGIRDTLRVLLGIVTEPPRLTGPEANMAADYLLRRTS